MSCIFINQAIGVMMYFCECMELMRQGQIVEIGDAQTICTSATHPYTKALISAVPYPDAGTPRMNQRIRFIEPQTQKAPQ
jgi:peptide/nickel transport system ATP-binding protein